MSELDEYTLNAVRALESESHRLAEVSGIIESTKSQSSRRRRKMIREVKRRVPGIDIFVELRSGLPLFRIKGTREQEQEAIRILNDLIKSDDIFGPAPDPFQVADFGVDELARRWEERGSMLEIIDDVGETTEEVRVDESERRAEERGSMLEIIDDS